MVFCWTFIPVLVSIFDILMIMGDNTGKFTE